MCQERSRHPLLLTLVGVLRVWMEAKHLQSTQESHYVGKYLLQCTSYAIDLHL